jgi:hypothetical protein
MAIGVYFPENGFTTAQYKAAVKKLADTGHGAPKGRQYHCAFGDPNNLQIFDVWDSQELFDKFGEALIPILAEQNYTPPQPMIAPVHGIIEG